MDVGQIRELIKVIEASDVSEVVIEEGDSKITVRRGFVAAAPVAQGGHGPGGCGRPRGSVRAFRAPVGLSPGVAGRRSPHRWWARSTRRLARVADDFVDVGDAFEEGATMCILEAMKLMNEIVAEESGVVREIAVSNGDSVEYGTVLFYYEPS